MNDFSQYKGCVIHSAIEALQGYSYDFHSVEIRSGEVVDIVFIKDDDGETLGYREESLYGSSDQETDTDQSDYDEIRNGWLVSGEPVVFCPYLSDSDFDGLSDVEEKTLGNHLSHRDSDQDGYSDYLENESSTDPLGPTNALLKNIIFSEGLILSLEEISMIKSVGLVDTEIAPSDSYYPINLPVGESSITITLDSYDSASSNEYTINFGNSLGAPGFFDQSKSYYTKNVFSFSIADDSRVSNYIIVRSETETPFSPVNGIDYYSDVLFDSAATMTWDSSSPLLNADISEVHIKNEDDTYTEDPDFKLTLGFIRPGNASILWIVDDDWGDWDIPDNVTKSHPFGTSGQFSVDKDEVVQIRWYVEVQDCGTYWNETVTVTDEEMRDCALGDQASGVTPNRSFTADLVNSKTSRLNEMKSYSAFLRTESVTISVGFDFSISCTEPSAAPEDDT